MKQHSVDPKHAKIQKNVGRTPLSPELAQGQMWKMEGEQMEIMLVGKHLADYRLHQKQKRAPTRSGVIREIQFYLKEKRASLVKNNGLARDHKAPRL